MTGTDHPPSTTSPMSPRRRVVTPHGSPSAWPWPPSSASSPSRPATAGLAAAAEPAAGQCQPAGRRPGSGRHPRPDRLCRRRPSHAPTTASTTTTTAPAAAHDAAPRPRPRRPSARRHGQRLQRPEQPRRLGSPRPVRVRRQLGRQHRQRLLRRHPVLASASWQGVGGSGRPDQAQPRDPDRHGPALCDTRAAGATGPACTASSATARLPPDRPSTGPARATRSVPAPVTATRQAPTGAGARPARVPPLSRRPCPRPAELGDVEPTRLATVRPRASPPRTARTPTCWSPARRVTRTAVTALRTTLAAFANAEAPPAPERSSAAPPVVGLIEHDRLTLGDRDHQRILQEQISIRSAAATEYDTIGQAEAAATPPRRDRRPPALRHPDLTYGRPPQATMGPATATRALGSRSTSAQSASSTRRRRRRRRW